MLGQMTVIIGRRALEVKVTDHNDSPGLWSRLLDGRLFAQLLQQL